MANHFPVTRMILLLLALSSFALAEEAQVTFKTDPAGAQVYVNSQYVGLSGQKLKLDLDPQSQLMLSFELSGFRQATASTLASMLLSNDQQVFPLDGSVVVLQPNSLAGYMRRFPPWMAVVLLGLSALVLTLATRYRRQMRRAQRVEELIARAPENASRVARSLGGYLLVDLLGGGGMAQVYRGVPSDTLDTSRAVAVKLLHRAMADDLEQRQRFEREIGVCFKLDHPNIVHTLDYGVEEEGNVYLLMELVGGGTLRDRVKAEGLSREEALRLLEPIFSAVSYAHRQGIVHRDLKPENILLSEGGVPKVSDFGLARAGDSETLTATGTALGTPAYMAPEQVGGRPGPAADQYALGVIAYELLAGRKPFENADPVQLIFMHVSENARPPSRIRPALPGALDDVILRMLAKEPENRFLDVDQAWSALRAALERLS